MKNDTNFSDFRRIITEIHSAEIITVKDSLNIEAKNQTHLIYIISGSCIYSSFSSDKETSSGELPLGSVHFLDGDIRFTLSTATEQCSILHIVFSAYIFSKYFREDECGDMINLSGTQLRFFQNYRTTNSYESLFPYYRENIKALIKECDCPAPDKCSAQVHLEKILTSIHQTQLENITTVLSSVSGVAIINDSKIKKTPFELSIGDIFVWSDNPDTVPNSILLLNAMAEQKYIEQPSRNEDYSYIFHRTLNDKQLNYGTFEVKKNEDFKLWLFPNANYGEIIKYKESAVICFKAKSNTPCRLKLLLHHIPSYQALSYPITFSQPNVWTDFTIPVLETTTLGNHSPYIDKIIWYIQQNYSQKITVRDIADFVHLHPSHLSEVFKKTIHQTLHSYINFYRINIAKQRLKETDESITEIAISTGFFDAQHFLKAFKKETGITPTEFRNQRL